MSIDFKQKIVEGVASEYEKVSLTPEYRKLLEEIASVMYPFLGMSEGAVRGFISRAIVEWQRINKKSINAVSSFSVKERQLVMKQGMDIMYNILSSNVLKSQSDKPKLKKAIDEGLRAYFKSSFKK